MRILLAEDQRVHARLVASSLEHWGHEVIVTADGDQAWAVLTASDSPRLAILDWMMPGISGLDLCRRLRAEPRLAGIYVILLTTRGGTEDVVEGLASGANDFVTKPFEPRELRARIDVGARVVDLEARLADRVAKLEEALELQRRAEAEVLAARERELHIGERIQQTLLLGAPPALSGLEIAAFSAPSQGIDGDFYDFFPGDDGSLDLVVGDVMGKGVPAALMAAATKAYFLRMLAAHPNREEAGPSEIVGFVSRQVSPRLASLESFVTLAYARVTADRRLVRLVDAGHTGTLLIRSGGTEIVTLAGDSLPLGVVDEQGFKEVTATTAPGDLLIFYSDGVTEARAPDGTFFGIARLIELLGTLSSATATQVVAAVTAAIQGFAGGAPLADDLTCVVAKFTGHETGTDAAPRTLTLDSSLDELPRLRAWVEGASASLPVAALGEAARREIMLAVNEAVVNIMAHAYKDRPKGWIRLEYELTSETLTFILHHGGRGFDPESVAPPDFSGSRPSGFGLFIIRQCFSEVRFDASDPDTHRVVLVRRLTAS